MLCYYCGWAAFLLYKLHDTEALSFPDLESVTQTERAQTLRRSEVFSCVCVTAAEMRAKQFKTSFSTEREFLLNQLEVWSYLVNAITLCVDGAQLFEVISSLAQTLEGLKHLLHCGVGSLHAQLFGVSTAWKHTQKHLDTNDSQNQLNTSEITLVFVNLYSTFHRMLPDGEAD